MQPFPKFYQYSHPGDLGRVPNPLSVDWPGAIVDTRKNGLFLRPAHGRAGLELLVGSWGLIPRFADTLDNRHSTKNAWDEGVTNKPSFKEAWRRCIIPADWFNEPNREISRNAWWRFYRADGTPTTAESALPPTRRGCLRQRETRSP